MSQQRLSGAAVMLAVAMGGCSGAAGDATPVAVPSAVLDRETVEAGHVLDVTYRFAVSAQAPPFREDYVVFVHAYDEHGERLWTGDHQPKTPTRAWKAGEVVEYTQSMLVPRRAPAGVVRLEAGLYSPGSGARLPLEGTGSGRRSYRVGSFRVSPPVGGSTAIFMEGWYDVETDAAAPAVEWRWSRKSGELWFRNPRRDAVLVLEVDGAVPGIQEPRQLEIRVGTFVADRFELMPRLDVRRTLIPADRFGEADVARVTIAVDKPFVPAQLPDAPSADTRELGVRVFDAHLELP